MAWNDALWINTKSFLKLVDEAGVLGGRRRKNGAVVVIVTL